MLREYTVQIIVSLVQFVVIFNIFMIKKVIGNILYNIYIEM